MSNYFYHPLGDYAQNYIDGSATPSERPHTYPSHGWNKIDFGVGGGRPVYSMTNGIITNCGYFGQSDGQSKYGVAVKTTDCGYSRMMAKLKGGSPEDYPIYFTYIEMDNINEELEKERPITKGTFLGETNYDYAGSNLHFDIQPYERYSNTNEGNAKTWYGCISLDQRDAYGDKGSSYNLKDHLDPNFSMDEHGNLKDSTGKYIGLKGDDGIYYPPGLSGEIISKYTGNPPGMTLSELDWIGGRSTQINKWYAYAIMMQTPVKFENNDGDVVSKPAGWYPTNKKSETGIEGYFSNGTYTYPIYAQGGGPWANEKYWDGTFSSDACNITCVAIISSGLKGTNITPLYVKKIAYEMVGVANDSEMTHDKGQQIIANLPNIYKKLGLAVTNNTTSLNEIKEHLKTGKPAQVDVKGDYGAGTTKQGHFICFLAYNEQNDTVFIGDPSPYTKGSGWYSWKAANATFSYGMLVE